MFGFNLWKVEVPKENVEAIIAAMDSDMDGYISLGEVRDMLRSYAKKVKRSMRFELRRQ